MHTIYIPNLHVTTSSYLTNADARNDVELLYMLCFVVNRGVTYDLQPTNKPMPYVPTSFTIYPHQTNNNYNNNNNDDNDNNNNIDRNNLSEQGTGSACKEDPEQTRR